MSDEMIGKYFYGQKHEEIFNGPHKDKAEAIHEAVYGLALVPGDKIFVGVGVEIGLPKIDGELILELMEEDLYGVIGEASENFVWSSEDAKFLGSELTKVALAILIDRKLWPINLCAIENVEEIAISELDMPVQYRLDHTVG